MTVLLTADMRQTRRVQIQTPLPRGHVIFDNDPLPWPLQLFLHLENGDSNRTNFTSEAFEGLWGCLAHARAPHTSGSFKVYGEPYTNYQALIWATLP